MFLRVALFALMAFGLGGFGVVAWVALRPAVVAARPAEVAAPAPAPVVRVTVLVAARALRPGALLKPEEVTAREITGSTMPEGMSEDSPSSRASLVGAMIRRAVAAGEPLVASDVMRPGDHGFLAAVLAPGARAVTIGVDAVSGSAGLIWPGDRVDVIMTQSLDDKLVPLGRRIVSQTIQQNARVIAIDQQLVQGSLAGSADAAPARTVTLEVIGDQAQRVQVASRIGRLSLSVRSADVTNNTDSETAVYASDVSSALARQPDRVVPDMMRVHSGTQDSKEYRF